MVLRDIFADDTKVFNESFAYGEHFVVTEINERERYCQVIRLRKRKKKLYIDEKEVKYLQLIDINWSEGDWLFSNPTGGKKWEYEWIGNFAVKNRTIKKVRSVLRKGVPICL